MVDGRWKMVDGRWKMLDVVLMSDVIWKMLYGRWKMVDGRWVAAAVGFHFLPLTSYLLHLTSYIRLDLNSTLSLNMDIYLFVYVCFLFVTQIARMAQIFAAGSTGTP